MLPSNFDPATYLALNPDVQLAGVDPKGHFLQHGIREGRRYAIQLPEDFDSAFYASRQINSEVSPEIDWYLRGRREGIPYTSRNNFKVPKWYFAVSEDTLKRPSHDWPRLIVTAVLSALSNTDLHPVMLYDGEPNRLTMTLSALGVTVIPHRVSIFGSLEKFFTSPEALAIAQGAFLRIDIPEIEKEHEFVLYTDCDVVFRRQPNFSFDAPRFLAAAPQAAPNDYENDMNSGVMVLNVPALRSELDSFRDFICQNLSDDGLPGYDAFDQHKYRRFYASRMGYLPLRMNWKPYWGINEEAEIIHWHGPKPSSVEAVLLNGSELQGAWGSLFSRSKESYLHYLLEHKSALNFLS